ncbi:YrdB family protein [Mesobacillus maritimus]|uniref:YrdB family protein n=1 Tax=Mesobacillus maritimus TaxID=1643336 RepID=UPI00203D32A8|nr:YrdB family protein [Mesobacillus maritimus]MCM3587816.1 YrdB family protein [Mesobacillus maritimus]
MTLLIMASRFICEILALIIFGIWGFQQGKMIGAIGVPLVVAVIWSMLGSPNAPYKLQGFYGSILELVLFSAASFLLYSLGHTYLAFIYFIIAFGVSMLIHFMDI